MDLRIGSPWVGFSANANSAFFAIEGNYERFLRFFFLGLCVFAHISRWIVLPGAAYYNVRRIRVDARYPGGDRVTRISISYRASQSAVLVTVVLIRICALDQSPLYFLLLHGVMIAIFPPRAPCPPPPITFLMRWGEELDVFMGGLGLGGFVGDDCMFLSPDTMPSAIGDHVAILAILDRGKTADSTFSPAGEIDSALRVSEKMTVCKDPQPDRAPPPLIKEARRIVITVKQADTNVTDSWIMSSVDTLGELLREFSTHWHLTMRFPHENVTQSMGTPLYCFGPNRYSYSPHSSSIVFSVDLQKIDIMAPVAPIAYPVRKRPFLFSTFRRRRITGELHHPLLRNNVETAQRDCAGMAVYM